MSKDDYFKISNTYFPNITPLLKLLYIDDYRQKRVTNKSENSNETEESIVMVGLSNGWKRNIPYFELVERWDIMHLDNQEITSIFETWLLGSKEKKKIIRPKGYAYNELTKHVPKEIRKAIISKNHEKWKIRQLSSIFMLSEVVWRAIINESKYLEKLERIEKSKSKFPYNISGDHIKWAKDYLIENATTPITIMSLKTYLDHIDYLRKLSKSGIRHLLKNVLKYSYKSAHKLSK